MDRLRLNPRTTRGVSSRKRKPLLPSQLEGLLPWHRLSIKRTMHHRPLPVRLYPEVDPCRQPQLPRRM
jgi:hypothetical protein